MNKNIESDHEAAELEDISQASLTHSIEDVRHGVSPIPTDVLESILLSPPEFTVVDSAAAVQPSNDEKCSITSVEC